MAGCKWLTAVCSIAVVVGCAADTHGPAAAVAADAPAKAPSAEAAKGWLLFRGDSLMTGVASDALPEKLTMLWKFKVPNGAFEATAVIADGVVYVGDLDGHFFALDLAT